MERPDGKSFRAARRIANVLFAGLIVEMPRERRENRAKKSRDGRKDAGKKFICVAPLPAERKQPCFVRNVRKKWAKRPTAFGSGGTPFDNGIASTISPSNLNTTFSCRRRSPTACP